VTAQPETTIIQNARVFTADPANPWAEAVVVRGSRILFAGGSAEAAAWKGPGAVEIDAGGKTLMPGFIDSHFHLLYGALNLDGMQFGDTDHYEQLADVILAYAAENPADEWLHGAGLRYNAGPGASPLNRHHLDAVVPDRPIYINSYDGHTSWANTRALELAGIFYGGKSGPNSEIVLDERGEATGELRESGAFTPVSQLVPQPDEARKMALLRKALQQTAAFGITSVHNMDGNAEQAAIYSGLAARGELTCRIYIPYSVTPETPILALGREALALKEAYSEDEALVRAGGVKFFMDGVIESYTGLVVDPYADKPSTRGETNYPVHSYTRLVREADRLGFQIFTHAVGDLGVRLVLAAYESAQRANSPRDSRHRIEHIELVHPADVPRFKSLGVIASMQPMHAPAAVDDGDVWPERVGRERWPLSFAWQTLREAGAVLAFGSDWPVVTPDPLAGIHNAINRMPWSEGLPNHRQTLADTLIAYTRDAAFAEFMEHSKGQVKAGYLADLVLLSEDIFATDPTELRMVHPLLTMVDGRVVYRR
jgi:hypothetical protein